MRAFRKYWGEGMSNVKRPIVTRPPPADNSVLVLLMGLAIIAFCYLLGTELQYRIHKHETQAEIDKAVKELKTHTDADSEKLRREIERFRNATTD